MKASDYLKGYQEMFERYKKDVSGKSDTYKQIVWDTWYKPILDRWFNEVDDKDNLLRY